MGQASCGEWALFVDSMGAIAKVIPFDGQSNNHGTLSLPTPEGSNINNNKPPSEQTTPEGSNRAFDKYECRGLGTKYDVGRTKDEVRQGPAIGLIKQKLLEHTGRQAIHANIRVPLIAEVFDESSSSKKIPRIGRYKILPGDTTVVELEQLRMGKLGGEIFEPGDFIMPRFHFNCQKLVASSNNKIDLGVTFIPVTDFEVGTGMR
jgi:hypothetical protein